MRTRLLLVGTTRSKRGWGDVAVLNDVNVAVAANVLVTVCDLDIAAAVLAAQAVGDVSQTVCETTAGPLEIVQS